MKIRSIDWDVVRDARSVLIDCEDLQELSALLDLVIGETYAPPPAAPAAPVAGTDGAAATMPVVLGAQLESADDAPIHVERPKRAWSEASPRRGPHRVTKTRCPWCRKEVHGKQGLAPHQRACPKRPKTRKARPPGQVACPKCDAKMLPRGLSIHLAKKHGIRGSTKAASRSSARTDVGRSSTVEPGNPKSEDGANPGRLAQVPTAKPAEEPTRPLEGAPDGAERPGVVAYLRRKGPPYGHSNEQVRRMFPSISPHAVEVSTSYFRAHLKKERGGKWSNVGGVWTWHPPVESPPGSGTEPSGATSTEPKS